MSTCFSYPYSSHDGVPAIHAEPTNDSRLPALLSSTLQHLIEWLHTTWAMAVDIQNGAVRHAYTFGTSRDRRNCLEYVASVTRRTSGDQDCHLHVAPADANERRPSLIAWSKTKDGIRALAFGPKMDGAAYSGSDCALILEAVQSPGEMAPSVTKTHTFCEDLITARDIQRRSLKLSPPCVKGVEFHGDLLPGSGLVTEFFDFVAIDTTRLAVAIGNVSGQGVGAALLMSGLQGFLRTLTHEEATDAAAVVRELNRVSYDLSENQFVAALFYGQLDPASNRLRYVNAGHDPVLLIRSNGSKIELLESTGTVLGLSRRSAYAVRTVPVRPGDILVACSRVLSRRWREHPSASRVRFSKPCATTRGLALAISLNRCSRKRWASGSRAPANVTGPS